MQVTAEPYTESQEHTPAKDFFQLAADLRAIAALLDEMADCGEPLPDGITGTLYIGTGYGLSDDDIRCWAERFAREFSPVTKDLTEYSYYLVRQLPVVKVRYELKRSAVCRKVKVVKEVEEWQCEPILGPGAAV